MWPFSKPKPTPPGVIIRNRLGEQIDLVEGVWLLEHADLRSRQWPHVDLSGMSLWGANLEGANLMGARLVRTSFWGTNLTGADISYSNASSADFFRAILVGTSLYRSNVKSARFDGAFIDEHTDIPGRKVTGLMRVSS